MYKFLILICILLSDPILAAAPECPTYKNKRACLLSVEDNYKHSLEFIEDSYDEGGPQKDELIQASLDIKKYETLACQKTCLE